MLQMIRSRVTSIFVKALFVLLIASFAVWGIGDIFLGSPTGKAAIEVGDVEITTAEVLDEFERTRRTMGLQMTAEEAAEIGLLDQVMSDLANRALFIAEAGDLGLAVGEDQVKQWIAEMPAFQDQTGRFNADIFRQALFRTQLSEAAFVNLLREEIRRDQLVNAVTAGLVAPDIQAETYFAYRNEEREALLLTLDAGTLPAPAEPSDADISGFYNDNTDRYRAPEYRAATVIALTPDALAEDIAVPEDQLREEYETRLDEFRTPGRRTVDQIFLADKETADRAAAALGEGRSFQTVAEEIAEMASDALSLGSVTRADLEGTTLADAVFEAELNAPTTPVESDLGWHIFRVTEITEETVQPFDDVKDALRINIARNDALDRIFEIANRIEDALAAGETIEEAARTVDIDIETVTGIDRQGQDDGGNSVVGIAADPRFRATLFSTPLEEQSQLEETGDGGYFILRVDGITEATVRPLADVRDRAREDLIAERRADANLRRAQALVQEAASGGLAAAGEAGGFAVQTLEAFSRNGDGLPDVLPADVAEIAFDLKIGDIGLSEDLTQIHIVELTAINDADRQTAEEDIASLARQVQSGMAADAVTLLIEALQESHDVSINPALPLGVIQGGLTGGAVPQQSGGLF